MMLGLSLWLRRGISSRAAIGLVTMHVVVMFLRSGWWHEWDWALSQAGLGASLTGPVVAGLVAYDASRRNAPTLALLASQSARGSLASLTVAMSGWLWAVAAWFASVVLAGAIAFRDATGLPDLLPLLEAPAFLAFCAAAGLVAGTAWRGPLVGPAVAMLIYGGGILIPNLGLGLTGVLRVTGTTGSLIALERTPSSVYVLVGVHVAGAVLCGVVSVARPPSRMGTGFRRVVALTIAALLVAVSLISAHEVSRRVDPYRWRDGADLCVHGSVTVCGPRQGGFVIQASQRSLSAAIRHLHGSGIAWQRTYLIPHRRSFPPTVGPLDVSPEDVRDGGLSNETVVAALASPRLCRDSFSSAGSAVILKRQTVVADWVEKALGTPSMSEAPPEVKAAFHGLSTCAPMTAIP